MGNEFCMESRGPDDRRQRYPAQPQPQIHQHHPTVRDYPQNNVTPSQHYFKEGDAEWRNSTSSRTSADRPAVRFSPNQQSYDSGKRMDGSFTQSRRGILKNEPQVESVSYNAIRV